MRRSPLALAAFLAMLGGAQAQDIVLPSRETAAAPERKASLDFTTSDGWRAGKLVGLILYDSQGAKVGDVRDVVLDRTGQVRTVLVGTGGLLGVGEREILLPFSNIEWIVPAKDAAGADAMATAVGQATPIRGVVNLPRSQVDAVPTAH